VASGPQEFFTEPHCYGSPAVLVRLDAVEPVELGEVLTEAWPWMANRSPARDFEERLGR
jgi:hypothetical protein